MKFIHKTTVTEPRLLIDLLAEETELSRSTLKDCMNKGAVWLKRPRKKEVRVRRAKYQLKADDSVSLYYDSAILAQPVPVPDIIADEKRYSIWNKPAGLLSQGTKFGDHCSLLRFAEKQFNNQRRVFLVHRLDREASGLILIAHDQKAASAFSRLFGDSRDESVEKWYEAVVLGELSRQEFCIDEPLDGKQARTLGKVLSTDHGSGQSRLSIRILTGRYHQIRRHLSMIGHPIAGDSRYGKKNGEGLKLKACKLKFTCPLTGMERIYSL